MELQTEERVGERDKERPDSQLRSQMATTPGSSDTDRTPIAHQISPGENRYLYSKRRECAMSYQLMDGRGTDAAGGAVVSVMSGGGDSSDKVIDMGDQTRPAARESVSERDRGRETGEGRKTESKGNMRATQQP